MLITVVGQGYVGLPISICAAEAGHTVFGFDIDQDKISKLKLGITDSPEVSTDKLLDLQLRSKISFSSSIDSGSGSSIFGLFPKQQKLTKLMFGAQFRIDIV